MTEANRCLEDQIVNLTRLIEGRKPLATEVVTQPSRSTYQPGQREAGTFRSSAKVHPRIFKGDLPWEAYFTHFREVCKLNNWLEDVAKH